MRGLIDSYEDRVLVGEASLPSSLAYYGKTMPGFHLPFSFHLIKSRWNPQVIAALIEQYEAALGGSAGALAYTSRRRQGATC
jgi:alpha-glucosidase